MATTTSLSVMDADALPDSLKYNDTQLFRIKSTASHGDVLPNDETFIMINFQRLMNMRNK